MHHNETERSTTAPTDNRSADKDQLAELRDEVSALRAEVQRLCAERDGHRFPEDAREVASIAEVVEAMPRRDRDGAIDVHAVPHGTSIADGVSRRRLFGLLGGAAAAGAGLAVAGSALEAHRADAADHQPLVIGETNSNDNPGGTTFLNGSTSDFGFMFRVSNTATGGAGVSGSSNSGPGVFGESSSGTGVSGSSGSGRGVFGFSISGVGVVGVSAEGNSIFAGAPVAHSPGTHLQLDPSTDAGPPTSAAHTLGQFWMDHDGKLWQCVGAGTPGTWVDLTSGSKLVAVNPPARVYDSRNSDGPISTGETRAVTVAGVLGIPVGVSAVLTNLTATGANAAGFLAMVAHGAAPPSTSNLNLIPNQDLANNATSAVGANQVDVSCGGPVTSVNFIVDVFGYYP